MEWNWAEIELTSNGAVSNGVELQHATHLDQFSFLCCQIALNLLAFYDTGLDLARDLNIRLDFFIDLKPFIKGKNRGYN